MNATGSERACRRAAGVALLVAVGSAIAGLPRDVLPWPWLLALLAPATWIARWRRPPRRPFVRALLATALQLLACYGAYEASGPLARQAALAGTILPPLAFVTARRHDSDVTLGLFLGLCVLLVSNILGGGSTLLLLSFLTAATVQLRCEARLGALRSAAPSLRTEPGQGRVPWLSGTGLGALCALVATAIDRTLPLLPAPASTEAPAPVPGAGPRRSVGLPDSFELNGNGALLDLQGERLLEVRSLDNQPLPADLYLRSGFFDRPGLDSWRIGALERRARDTSEDAWRLRPPVDGVPVRQLEVLRLAAARNFVFVPPGLCSIFGIADLQGDALREWFRQPPWSGGDVYELAFQQLPPPADELPADARWQRLGLDVLPADLDQAAFAPLLREWQPHGGALQQAQQLASILQQRCRYERREPTGPYAHALLNFLHGDRVGFCMHFASAAAILLRMAGLPCRIGVGLFGGSSGGRADTRIFGSQHAHAWVEIPIAGHGWVVFDPTPPSERGARANVPLAAPDATAPADADAPAVWWRTASAALRAVAATPWPWLGVLLLPLLLAVRGARARTSGPPPLQPLLRPARRQLLQILRALAVRGYPRPPGTTLEAHTDGLLQLGACPPDLRAAFAAYQEVRFGGRPWDSERRQRLAAGLLAAELLPSLRPAPQ